MFYVEIIYKTILSFIVDLLLLKISITTFFLFLLFICLLILLWKNIKKINSNYKFFIIIIRILIILLILPLFQNSNFRIKEEKYEKQNIGIVIDNSKSILNTYSKFDISNILDSISIWGDNNNLNLYWYNLDSLINRNNLSIDNNSTNFSSLPNFSISNNLNQMIILSDGNINQGPSINNLSFSNDIIIHSIGLGPENGKQNANIVDVKINSNKDSTISEIKIQINSNIEDQKVLFNIYSDNYNNTIYSDTILIMKGDYLFDTEISLHNKIISNKLIYSLTPITFQNTDQNISDWEVKLNNNKKSKVLLLTGSISYNTSFLKNILNNDPDFELVHHILFNDDYVLSEDFDCIILDNFLVSEKQFNLMKNFHLLDVPILFFEGINSNLNYLNSFLNVYYNDYFYLERINKDKDILFDNFDIGSINTNFSFFLKNQKSFNKDKISFFSDSSLAVFESDKICLVLLPNISELDFYQRNKYNDEYLNHYISFLMKKYSNNSPINLTLNKSNYLKGESISFDISCEFPFKKENRKVVIQNIENGNIDTLLYNDNDIFLNTQGDYKIYFLYKGTNGELINSNIESFYVSKYSSELSKTSQNKVLLQAFSEDFNGMYVDISEFNYNYLSNFNIASNYKKYDHIFSALDIFIKYKIYLLVIMLFSLEIYLRKRIGLL